MMSNDVLSSNNHFLRTWWRNVPVLAWHIMYTLFPTLETWKCLFFTMFTDDGTSAPITHHYANVITQFITQFITQMPLLKSLLIITQRPFPLLIITQPLRIGHFADERKICLLFWVIFIISGGCIKFLGDFLFVRSFYDVILGSDLGATTGLIGARRSHKNLHAPNLHTSYFNGNCHGDFGAACSI